MNEEITVGQLSEEQEKSFREFLESLFSLPEEQLLIVKRIYEGKTQSEIAKEKKCSRQYISKLFSDICIKNRFIKTAFKNKKRFHKIER